MPPLVLAICYDMNMVDHSSKLYSEKNLILSVHATGRWCLLKDLGFGRRECPWSFSCTLGSSEKGFLGKPEWLHPAQDVIAWTNLCSYEFWLLASCSEAAAAMIQASVGMVTFVAELHVMWRCFVGTKNARFMGSWRLLTIFQPRKVGMPCGSFLGVKSRGESTWWRDGWGWNRKGRVTSNIS